MTATCQVRRGWRRCGHPAVVGLPVCPACLEELLAESDPGRRRTLASWGMLAPALIEVLASDPDMGVRLRVAARSDLPGEIVDQMIDPLVESSSEVREVLARGYLTSAQARALLVSGEPSVLVALAENLAAPTDVLDELVNHPDPEVMGAAVASRSGLRSSPHASHLLEGATVPLHRRPRAMRNAMARPSPPLPQPHPEVVPTDPTPPAFTDSPMVVPVEELPPPPPPVDPPVHSGDAPAATPIAASSLGEEPERDQGESPSGRVLVALVAACVLGVAVTAGAMALRGHVELPAAAPRSLPSSTTTPPATLPPTIVASTTSVAVTTLPASTVPATPAPPSTQIPAPAPPPAPPAPAPTPAPPVSQAPIVVPSPPSGPIERTFTVRSSNGRFCGSTRLTVQFSPSPAQVTVTSDTGERVAQWSGPSGATRTITLTRPTKELRVTVATTGTGITVSASAAGDSC